VPGEHFTSLDIAIFGFSMTLFQFSVKVDGSLWYDMLKPCISLRVLIEKCS
jgi:hypothetical protein